MKSKFIDAHMKVAEIYASLSSAQRLKVGCIIVKDNRIISIGYNGTPSGWDNACEDIVNETVNFTIEERIRYGLLPGEEKTLPKLKTKPEVIHAESNAISKLARCSESGEGATLFVTHAPCIECAKLIYQAGISTIYYKNVYRSQDGIDFLNKCNIIVERVETNVNENN